MAEVIPLTREIGAALPTLTAAARVPESDLDSRYAELRIEVVALLRSIDERRARGWHKVPYRELGRLRALVGVPEPEHPYTVDH